MRSSRLLLTSLAAACCLIGCTSMHLGQTQNTSAYKNVYDEAFTQFMAQNVQEGETRGKATLRLKDNVAARLINMAQSIDLAAAAQGIHSNTQPVTRSMTRDNEAKILAAFSDKFNPLAFHDPNGDLAFAQSLLLNGVAVTDTDYSVGDPKNSQYDRLFIVATLVKAQCGLFSCFNDPKDAVAWQIVKMPMTFISSHPSLRMAELAAMNWELDKARRLCEMGRQKSGYQEVHALIQERQAVKARFERNRAATQANTAYWKQKDAQRAAASRGHTTALIAQGLYQTSLTLNEATQQAAQNSLTTATAIGATESGNDAYQKHLAQLHAQKAAQLEYDMLRQVQSDLVDLYNEPQEGRVLRTQLDREIALAKTILDQETAKFNALQSDRAHREVFDAYIHQNPQKQDTILLTIAPQQKRAHYNQVKERYGSFYAKQAALKEKN